MNGDLLGSLLPLVVLFAIFYFLIIRPQQKQAKQHKEMLAALAKGDKIVTNGGVVVEVVHVDADTLKVKNIDGSEMKIVSSFVTRKWED
jgi:preprotein translocase subunit YajC